MLEEERIATEAERTAATVVVRTMSPAEQWEPKPKR